MSSSTSSHIGRDQGVGDGPGGPVEHAADPGGGWFTRHPPGHRSAQSALGCRLGPGVGRRGVGWRSSRRPRRGSPRCASGRRRGRRPECRWGQLRRSRWSGSADEGDAGAAASHAETVWPQCGLAADRAAWGLYVDQDHAADAFFAQGELAAPRARGAGTVGTTPAAHPGAAADTRHPLGAPVARRRPGRRRADGRRPGCAGWARP